MMWTRCRVVALALLLAGCSLFTAPPLVITGEGLIAVGKQFVATSTAITDACIAKRLSMETCDKYRAFSRKFKAAFEPAKTVQETAMAFGDKTMAENASAILTGLIKELGNFTILVTGGK